MISVNTEDDFKFAKICRTKPGKFGHLKKDLHTFTTLLCCSTTLFDCPQTNRCQSKNILRIPYELVKISGDLTTNTHELAPSRGE